MTKNYLFYDEWHRKALGSEEWTREEVRMILEELYTQRIRVLELEQQLEECGNVNEDKSESR